MKQQWKIDEDEAKSFDPLLECLQVICKLKYNPKSKAALTAGLPLEEGFLTPETYVRAAERANLSANIVKTSLREIQPHMLPVTLLLHNKKACVLVALNKQEGAMIIQPETGQGMIEISLDELEALYTEHAIFAKPVYQFDTRAAKLDVKKNKRWFWEAFKQSIPIYGEVLMASFLINLFALASPLFIMNVYDRVVPNAVIETLWVLAIGVIIVFSFEFVIKSLRSYFLDVAKKNIDIKLATRAFAQILGLEMGSRPQSVGSLASTVFSFESFRDFIASATVSTIVDTPFIILFLIIISFIGGPLVFIPLLAIPIILFTSIALQKPINKFINKAFLHSSEKQAVLFESIFGVETLKSVRAESSMQRRWERIISQSENEAVKFQSIISFGLNFAQLIQQVAVIFVVVYGVYLIKDGQITMGALIASTILAGRALAPVQQIAGLLSRNQQAREAINALDQIMQLPVERPADKNFLNKDLIKGEIEFRRVNFTYPGQPAPALENITFKISAGEHVGIIGRTGSGKSSLQKLVMKLYNADSGNILIDGTEIQQLDPNELRANIGYLPQDVILFHGSIRENITMGAPHVDDKTIIEAAHMGALSSFVATHPDGFNRQVGERGQNLSGGQRQAIAISRALLLDPNIVVLDEPTSSLDNNSSSQLVDRLKDYCEGKTLLLVTHKISMLMALVDRLIVIDGGRILADGPKEDVLRQLTERQIKAQIDETRKSETE